MHEKSRITYSEALLWPIFIKVYQDCDRILSTKYKFLALPYYRLAQIHAFQKKKHEALQSIEVFGKKSLNIDLFDLMICDPMLENL